jgi:predicted nucleotide-binding protein
MEKTKRYHRTKFGSRIIRRAIDLCRDHSKDKTEAASIYAVTIADEEWRLDNLDECLASYMDVGATYASIHVSWDKRALSFSLTFTPLWTSIEVKDEKRASIEKLFSVFEEASSEEKITIVPATETEKLTIFIGHGQNNQWEKLKSHLQDKHDLEIVAYETGARAGHTIRDILDNMLEESSLALLVLTGEDKTKTGMRARQNVIHECGLFQGRLGFDRAILIVEQDVELASNFDGIQQLRFERDRISEVFGDVIATIRREFGPN